MTKKILSLFDYSGTWCKPYRNAGYEVTQIDIKHGRNVFDIDQQWIADNGPFHGILAAPPCTDFSGSGAQYWKAKDADGRTAASVAMVTKTIDIVRWANPAWWALENPVGRLNKCVPMLKAFGPKYFQPWWYGDDEANCYTKKTGLWGQFVMPPQTHTTLPTPVCKQGSWLMKLGGKSERTKELRSITPPGFAAAFFNANP